MVLNLDKCIGCHTCSVTCKNVWTTREGVEYAWFNNVETKPGVGYPKEWENQKRWNGGWRRKTNGKIEPRMGAKWRILANIFANPDLPEIDDYYEPFTFDYEHLQTAPEMQGHADGAAALADHRRAHGEDRVRARTGRRSSAANSPSARRTSISRASQKEIYGQFENTFMMYLPRLCEHCLNPACVAACPSGAIYKREEDGIVLIDQDKCRGWRMCVSGCPYKKIYYNWTVGKVGEMHLLLSRASRPASRPCARRPASGASAISASCSMTPTASRRRRASPTRRTSTRRSSASSSIPNDPAVIAQARADGVPDNLDRGGEALAGVEDGDGLEGRLPAASGIPHPADGLVRAAAVADPVGGGGRHRSGIDGDMPDVRSLAHPAEISRQHADRRRKKSRSRWRSNACWRCAPICARKTVDGVIDEAIAASASA